MTQLSYPKDKIHVVLFEGIHSTAVENFERAGYVKVTHLSRAAQGQELVKLISSAHMVGIRSRTKLTAEVLAEAPKLMGIGCFCIGTNQVDLEAAARQGIPVFNAPHSNTRSVAELVIAESVMLLRGLTDKSSAAHAGKWTKSAKHSHELRGRTIGIVGYGHIGSQVSILAEAFGLRVVYFDVIPKLPMGNARQVDSLEELLAESDIVTLHVPQDPSTKNLMSAKRIRQIKPGAILINASRGNVIDIDALRAALVDEHVMGAAIDVFPVEPKSNTEPFESTLQGLPNVVLTPHIGGSTLEAQQNIGVEVSTKLVQYSDLGSTIGAVNFPTLSLPPQQKAHRLLHIHQNKPGVMTEINSIVSDQEINIVGQYLQTTPEVGYVVMDVNREHGPGLLESLRKVRATLKARVLY
ncbi:MAG: phosphoglycerate dehydrogenase [Myxococcota bacterium]